MDVGKGREQERKLEGVDKNPPSPQPSPASGRGAYHRYKLY